MFKTSEKEAKPNIDEYSKTIGEIGKWQIGLLLVLCLPIKAVLPGIQFGIVFLAPKTSFQCISRLNYTGELINDTCYDDCQKYRYYSEFSNSIISEWDLICDRKWMVNFSQSLSMGGIILGSFLFSFISDRYGRRLCLVIASILETTLCFILPFSPDYWTFLAIRFFIGTVCAGTMMTSFVFLIEIFGINKREMMGAVYMIPSCFGSILMSSVAYYYRDWRQFSIGIAIPTLIYLSYFFVLPESPKWLITVGKLDKASEVMESAAKWNKLPTDGIREIVERISNEGLTDKQRDTKANFLDLIRLKSLRAKTLYSCVIWFVVGVCLYGVSQYFGQTFPNPFLANSVVGVVQLPCYLIGGLVSKKCGRRSTIIGFLIVGAVCNALLALSDEFFYIKLFAGALGICSNAAVFNLIYVYTPELFPTVARNMAFGTSSVANRVGSMIAPFVGTLHALAPWAPAAVFATAPVLAVVACYCLPETKGKKLDDYLQQ